MRSCKWIARSTISRRRRFNEACQNRGGILRSDHDPRLAAFVLCSGQGRVAWNVSQLETCPDLSPVMNQRVRCSDEPWVKASGMTSPRQLSVGWYRCVMPKENLVTTVTTHLHWYAANTGLTFRSCAPHNAC